jgi:tetratricopeptide (TPR) repeat protein
MARHPVRWTGAAAVAGLLAALPAGARADDDANTNNKKKPGLFDFEPWRTPVGHERAAARHLVPGRFDLTPDPGVPSEPRVVRVRVYADRDYRGLVLRWQLHLHDQIKRINGVVEPVFAVRFDIDSLRDWDRAHSGVSLDAILAELEALDPAKDVDLVVGLVTPMQGVATSMHQAGLASILSHHFVLRGMDSEQEIRALDREFTLLDPAERQDLYDLRKLHKEVALFLHEWGHTLGLLHHEDRAALMNPTYDIHQSGFSPFERQVISVVIDRRAADPTHPFPESGALEPLLAHAPTDEGTAKERADLLDIVHRRGRAAAQVAGGDPFNPAAGLTHDEVDPYNRAVAAANADRVEEGWTDFGPIAQRLAAVKAPGDPAVWRRAASLATSLGALSSAEALLANLDRKEAETNKLAIDIDTRRHRVLLPPDAEKLGVPPAREVAYVAAYRDAARALEGTDGDAARALVQALAAAFPDTPAANVAACELDLRARSTKKRAEAVKRCEAAQAEYPDATRPLILLAAAATNDRRDAVAEKHLKRAVLLDPTDPVPWQMLARLYRATHATLRLTELSGRHQALFSTPLPE